MNLDADAAARERRQSPVNPSTGSLVILVALLLGSTTINYIDRQVFSVLAPVLRDEFGLNHSQYAAILNAFMMTYMVSYALGGWFIDRTGVARGLTVCTAWWSGVGALTALSTGPLGMSAFRALLAVGEGGAWPAFAKAVSLWVPTNARTLAIGICNSGSSLGSMIAPPLVVWLAQFWGWRGAFVITGALGFLWMAAFLWFWRAHPELRESDRRPTRGDPDTNAIRWPELLSYRQTWAVFFCRFFADPLWYFFVFWIPEYLVHARHMSMAGMAAVSWIPFLVSGVASFIIGYLVLALQRRGWSANRTRKTFMLVGAIMCPIGTTAAFAGSIAGTIALISIATFFFVAWSISVHTLPSDYFPPELVGSVFGIGGTGSTLGTVISIWVVGRVLDLTGSYVPVFVGIGALMPVACIAGFSLMGRVERLSLNTTAIGGISIERR